jgi:SAM-dependent methyltransferase
VASEDGDGDVRPSLSEAPGAPRLERSSIEYPEAAWTAFDRYARYAVLARTVRRTLGPGTHRVLDVGDGAGYLETFDPGLQTVSVDLEANPQRLVGTVAVVGDGRRLPFADRAFDAVTSCDALEHVPGDDRAAFVRELHRASADLVVVAAPFDTPGVAGAEEFVRRFVPVATGDEQSQLEEHARYGLPDLDGTVGELRASGATVAIRGNGHLNDWLLGMLIKHQAMAAVGLASVDQGFDILYNWTFAARNDVPPFYRHVVAARRDGEIVFGESEAPSDHTNAEGVLAALLAANGIERLSAKLAELHVHQADAFEHFMARFAGLESAVADLQARTGEVRTSLEQLKATLGHPARALARRLRGH